MVFVVRERRTIPKRFTMPVVPSAVNDSLPDDPVYVWQPGIVPENAKNIFAYVTMNGVIPPP
jgi:hypothetical protein